MYTSDHTLLYSKLDDAVYLCQQRMKPYFFSFLTEEEQACAERYLRSVCFENYSFFGGYEGAERKVLGLFFDDPAPFPVFPIEFIFRPSYKLTHRDFLGALMSLGLERETVGDILIEDGRAVAFVKTEIKDYVMSQIGKVGNVGVKLSEASEGSLPKGRETKEMIYSVSSMRVDNIVSAVTGLSREKSKELILSVWSASIIFRVPKSAEQLMRATNLPFAVRENMKYAVYWVIQKSTVSEYQSFITDKECL